MLATHKSVLGEICHRRQVRVDVRPKTSLVQCEPYFLPNPLHGLYRENRHGTAVRERTMRPQ